MKDDSHIYQLTGKNGKFLIYIRVFLYQKTEQEQV